MKLPVSWRKKKEVKYACYIVNTAQIYYTKIIPSGKFKQMSLVVHILNSQLNNFCLNLCFFLIAAELLDDLLDQPRVTDESRDDADDEDDDADDADEEEEGDGGREKRCKLYKELSKEINNLMKSLSLHGSFKFCRHILGPIKWPAAARINCWGSETCLTDCLMKSCGRH